MSLEERETLLEERRGILEDCNLWDFWDGLSVEQQNSILDYFKNTPLLFDYRMLFKGDWQNDLYHGTISVLMNIFVRANLIVADYFFSKFLEYNPNCIDPLNGWTEL